MNLDEMKRQWQQTSTAIPAPPQYDEASLASAIKTRTKKNKGIAMRYFWGAFTFHLIVFGFLAHVLIRYGGDVAVLGTGVLGFMITLPFTIVMMKRFKKLAVSRLRETHGPSVQEYVRYHYETLSGFFTFKKRYELFLIPLQCAIGVFISFRIFVPGGVGQHPVGAVIVFAITLLSCVGAIYSENRRNFEAPLQDLRKILDEYRS